MNPVEKYQLHAVHGNMKARKERNDRGPLGHLPNALASLALFLAKAACQSGKQIEFDFHGPNLPSDEIPTLFYTFLRGFSSLFSPGVSHSGGIGLFMVIGLKEVSFR
jgi:hypothetical protein